MYCYGGKYMKAIYVPNLAKLAKRILAIPCSSAKSERVFSTGGNIVTAKKSLMNPEKVECLITIKENKEQLVGVIWTG